MEQYYSVHDGTTTVCLSISNVFFASGNIADEQQQEVQQTLSILVNKKHKQPICWYYYCKTCNYNLSTIINCDRKKSQNNIAPVVWSTTNENQLAEGAVTLLSPVLKGDL